MTTSSSSNSTAHKRALEVDDEEDDYQEILEFLSMKRPRLDDDGDETRACSGPPLLSPLSSSCLTPEFLSSADDHEDLLLTQHLQPYAPLPSTSTSPVEAAVCASCKTNPPSVAVNTSYDSRGDESSMKLCGHCAQLWND